MVGDREVGEGAITTEGLTVVDDVEVDEEEALDSERVLFLGDDIFLFLCSEIITKLLWFFK